MEKKNESPKKKKLRKGEKPEIAAAPRRLSRRAGLADRDMEGEWQVVSRKKAASAKKSRRRKKAPADELKAESLTAEELRDEVSDLLGELRLRGYADSVAEAVRAALGERVLREIVCYGVGAFAEQFAHVPRWQLALALHLREALATGDGEESPVPMSFFDPVCGEREAELLGERGVAVHGENDMALREIAADGGGATLFFMPHCPLQLYSNVLWANWGEALGSILVFGNSFEAYAASMDARTSCVHSAAEACVEEHVTPPASLIGCAKPRRVDHAFNDTCVIRFRPGPLAERPPAPPVCANSEEALAGLSG